MALGAGRGLNQLQLTIELSARAGGHAGSTGKRKAAEAAGGSTKSASNNEKNAGKAKGEFKKRAEARRGEEQRTTRAEGWA